MDRIQKKETVDTLRKQFSEAESVVVTHYTGMTVAELTTLRKRMKKLGASFRVSKNRLTKLALKDTNYDALSNLFTGPTAVAFSSDPVSAAKAVVEYAKENQKLVILGGALNNAAMDIDQIKALATLPSLDELRAKIVGMINTPATRIAGVLQAPGGQLARVVNAYSQKQQG